VGYGFRKIGIVGAIPGAGTKPGTGNSADAYRCELGNVLEITGTNAEALTETLTLLRWVVPSPEPGASSNINASGEWRVWREDAPIQVTSSNLTFSARYELIEEGGSYFLLLASSDDNLSDLTADAQSVYYRSRH
jgi:hypothetical protein